MLNSVSPPYMLRTLQRIGAFPNNVAVDYHPVLGLQVHLPVGLEKNGYGRGCL